MRTFFCAAALVGLGLCFLASDASAAPSGTTMAPPVQADVPYTAYKPGWKGCDPCKTACPPTTCSPTLRYPYYRPYYYRQTRYCRSPYFYPRRGCNPCGRTGFYKRR